MAFEGSQPLKWSFEASADLSAKQYCFVKLGTDGKIAAATATTDAIIGVLQNKPTSGQMGEVVILGITKISADATLDESDGIHTSADSQAALDNTGTALGIVLKGAAAGELATAVVNCTVKGL